MVEWKTVDLESIVEPGRSISYGIVQPGAPVADGVPIVRVSDIRNGQVSTIDPLRVSPDIEANYSRTRLRGRELLLTLVGTVGETAVVPDELAGWNTARAVGVIPVRPDVGAYWVRLALNTPDARQTIATRLNTTVQATLNLSDVAQLPIVLPPQKEREAITSLLRAFDDKIELNRQTNETLEATARALFKSWFVDFDPVRDKSEGRYPGYPEKIAELFPSSFEDSEIGEIPGGWSVLALDEVATFLNGLALQKFPSHNEQSLPVIKIAQLRSGNTRNADKASADLPDDYIVRDGDVLFSWSGTLECVLWTGGTGALNQHLFRVASKKYPRWFYYLWIHRHLDEFRHIAASKATTMGHIQRHHLTGAKVVVPSPDLMRVADRQFEPIIERIVQNRIHSRTLGSIRDALLPPLMSGEVRTGRL